jgi:hypothetical protein
MPVQSIHTNLHLKIEWKQYITVNNLISVHLYFAPFNFSVLILYFYQYT